MPSAALLELGSRLQDVAQLLRAHEAVTGVEPGRRYDVEALNRSGVVLLCGHLEGFVEDLIDEAFALIHARNVPVTNLPDRLRHLQLATTHGQALEAVLGSRDRVRIDDRFGKVVADAVPLWDPAQIASVANLRSETLTSMIGSPRPKNLDRVFWYLGFTNIVDSISWQRAPSKQVRDSLNELVGKRHSIAHGTLGVKVGKGDVIRLRRYVVGTARSLDRKMGDWLKDVTGTPAW